MQKSKCKMKDRLRRADLMAHGLRGKIPERFWGKILTPK
jgi:hypothetical protein